MSAHPTSTSRVVLRAVTSEDQARFLELANASAAFHRPWVRLPTTPAEFSSYLARSDQVSAVCMVTCLRSGGDLVGMVNLNDIVRGSYQKCILGYAAFLPYVRQGYMSEAVALAVRHAFGCLNLHRVEADIQPDNFVSRRLIERLGFRKEGFSPAFIQINGGWRDHERWAITQEMCIPAVGQEHMTPENPP
ncbi:GNAT family N-acetyltransferase [Microbispora sp. H10670]|uniref:GNAT family N-acetyltransferase n=1 Tax=Microbispora sp. H10670 TaxID=2729108 RepID=UPI001602B01E|nr:GNAT family protein [Microbispora sp. H10670]